MASPSFYLKRAFFGEMFNIWRHLVAQQSCRFALGFLNEKWGTSYIPSWCGQFDRNSTIDSTFDFVTSQTVKAIDNWQSSATGHIMDCKSCAPNQSRMLTLVEMTSSKCESMTADKQFNSWPKQTKLVRHIVWRVKLFEVTTVSNFVRKPWTTVVSRKKWMTAHKDLTPPSSPRTFIQVPGSNKSEPQGRTKHKSMACNGTFKNATGT